MDTSNLEPVGTDILELVTRLWARHNGVAGADLDVLTVRVNATSTGPNDPGL